MTTQINISISDREFVKSVQDFFSMFAEEPKSLEAEIDGLFEALIETESFDLAKELGAYIPVCFDTWRFDNPSSRYSAALLPSKKHGILVWEPIVFIDEKPHCFRADGSVEHSSCEQEIVAIIRQ